ncbi:MAG: hypothetical protein K1000chlam4_01085 [Chlamydiae bacterium]|nr:hypothetical protein [Chlamydiota bacterium]
MRRNAQLVDLFAHENKWVFVEGVPSKQECDQRTNPQTYYLKSCVKVMGWDRDTVPAMLGLSPALTEAYLDKDQKQVAFFLTQQKPESSEKADDLERAQSEFLKSVFKLMEMMEEEKIDFTTGIWDSFQDRNQAMIETLEKTEDQASIRFVIAGEFHFIPIEDNDDPRRSVEPLRNYLRNKKAVILEHKFLF